MNYKSPELLAPAGSPDSLHAAVLYGADAVYLGCSDFANARMNAENFTKKTLVEAFDFCHSRNVKAYVTVNTLLSDKEMEGLYSYASFLYENGADGVIVQEAGVMDFLHRYLPNLPLHASTQAGVCNTAGLNAVKKLGCTRAVAARELSMNELEQLCKEDIEIEVFVHGALCACYSGFCLMSSLIGRRSGNRGKCAQPCRLPYSIDNNKPSLLMNLKDNLLLPHLHSLSKIGVSSLKIEGRMKGPEYVGLVTSFYRRALDGETINRDELEQLKKVFDRGGYTDEYYLPKKNHNMFAYTKPQTPYRVQQMPPIIPKQLPVSMHALLKKNQVFQLTVTDSLGNQGTAQGDTIAFAAQNRPLDENIIKERLNKLGNTPYKLNDCSVTLDPGLMIPLGELARVKRQACEELTEVRLKTFKHPVPKAVDSIPLPKGSMYQELQWTASVNTYEQYQAICHLPFAWVSIPLSVVWKHREEMDNNIIIRLPAVSHETKHNNIKQQLAVLYSMGFSHLMCGCLGDFYYFKNWERKGDITLWLYNSTTAQTLSSQNPSSLCLSPELNIGQIKQLQCNVPCEAYIYGRLPLMRTRHCFVQNARGNCNGNCQLTDRTGATFPTRCVNGEHILYNSTPLYMGDQLAQLKHSCIAYGRMEFTVESPSECETIAREIMEGVFDTNNKTRGHYHRGV
ncbi:MAG: U32 family peptidase [Ruminococcaceae bacterium]|nr:U32 family peptidase [Oscillospiraceae bacterium]